LSITHDQLSIVNHARETGLQLLVRADIGRIIYSRIILLQITLL